MPVQRTNINATPRQRRKADASDDARPTAHCGQPSDGSLWPSALILWGAGAASSSRSHAVQLILALTGELRVRPHSGGRWRQFAAVFLGPGAAHEVDTRGASVLVAFLDPEGALAGSLVRQINSKMVPVSDNLVAQWRRILGDHHTLEARGIDRWVRSELAKGGCPRHVHPGVSRVLRYLRQERLGRRGISLRRLAQVAELSPSRFMHVFTTSLGIPIRPYLLRLRVQRAARALVAGCTVTEAAHVAGFADAPHLTRTFRRVFGITPRELRIGFDGSSPTCSSKSTSRSREVAFPLDIGRQATSDLRSFGSSVA
jgi:AraC-like DNA-binding protein